MYHRLRILNSPGSTPHPFAEWDEPQALPSQENSSNAIVDSKPPVGMNSVLPNTPIQYPYTGATERREVPQRKTRSIFVDHLGIAVRSIDDAVPLFLNILGGKLVDRYTSNTPGVEVHVTAVEVGDMHFELLEPTNRESPVARFIRQKGPGVHHVAYRVDDLDTAILEAKAKGVRFYE